MKGFTVKHDGGEGCPRIMHREYQISLWKQSTTQRTVNWSIYLWAVRAHTTGKCHNPNCQRRKERDIRNLQIIRTMQKIEIKENWVVANKKADFNAIAKKLNIDPVTARILVNRDIPEENMKSFMECDFGSLHAPELMHGLATAADILSEKIRSGKKIRIMGDYDVDGVTSTYILWRSLSECGADVDTVIPDRIKDGYGINQNMVEDALMDGVDTILTCDNGIAAYSQIEYAKQYGLTVVLTDHHEIPVDEDGNEMLPPADVIVDPHQKADSYPFSEICGAVVAFKLMQSLLPGFLDKDRCNIILNELFELSALATVCDVMPLIDENRVIVKHALPKMKISANIGLRALVIASNLNGKNLDSFHLGFILGPCLNSAGRLKTADIALDLFKTQDPEEALSIATELVKTNEERRSLTASFQDKACEEIEASGEYKNKVIFLYIKDCHESLAGIIAGRIKEKYGRPAVVFTDAENGTLKGSGRSTDDFDMFSEFSAHKDLFIKFGGHKAAAGMTIAPESFDALKEIFNKNTEDLSVPETKITIDVPMPMSYCTTPLAVEFEKLAPFGNGNEKPLFAESDMRIVSMMKMGKGQNAAKISLLDPADKMYTAVYFGSLDEFNKKLSLTGDGTDIEPFYEGDKAGEIPVDVIYNLGVNDFRGVEAQIVIKNIRRKRS